MKQTIAGIVFAALWASASAATKFGIQSVDPLVLANVRFFVAGIGLLLFAYATNPRHPLPTGREWGRLLIFAGLNTTLYLGLFVLAMRDVSAGIGSLSTATNPLFITLLSALWLRRPLRWFEAAGLMLGMLGVVIATYPLLQDAHATSYGLLLLLISMLSVSAATVYYARFTWRLPPLILNGWQVLLGGVLLLPFTLLSANVPESQFDARFWLSVGWLIGPVSVLALQLWFQLVRHDTVRASLWLFLCPIFGFLYAAILFNEPITGWTVGGTLLVFIGLYLGQKRKFSERST